MRYRLRTLLILLAVGPPLLAITYTYFAAAPPVHGPIIHGADFAGNRAISRKRLDRETGLRNGARLSPRIAEQARVRIQQIYFEAGFSQATVVIVEGGRPEDKRLAFQIVEGNPLSQSQ